MRVGVPRKGESTKTPSPPIFLTSAASFAGSSGYALRSPCLFSFFMTKRQYGSKQGVFQGNELDGPRFERGALIGSCWQSRSGAGKDIPPSLPKGCDARPTCGQHGRDKQAIKCNSPQNIFVAISTLSPSPQPGRLGVSLHLQGSRRQQQGVPPGMGESSRAKPRHAEKKE